MCRVRDENPTSNEFSISVWITRLTSKFAHILLQVRLQRYANDPLPPDEHIAALNLTIDRLLFCITCGGPTSLLLWRYLLAITLHTWLATCARCVKRFLRIAFSNVCVRVIDSSTQLVLGYDVRFKEMRKIAIKQTTPFFTLTTSAYPPHMLTRWQHESPFDATL